MSECPMCANDPCTCHVPSTTPIRSTYRELPRGISIEEFGVDLFEAIKTQAGRLQALRTAVALRKSAIDTDEPKKRAALNAEAKRFEANAAALHATLTTVLQKVRNPNDVRKILAMQ
jgi:hypothetical protein